MGGDGSVAAVRPKEEFDYHQRKAEVEECNSIYSIEASVNQTTIESFRREVAIRSANSDSIDLDYMTAHLLIRDQKQIRDLIGDSDADLIQLANRGREIQAAIEDDIIRGEYVDDDSVAKMQEETRTIYEQDIPSALAEIDRLDTIQIHRHKVHMQSCSIPDQVPFRAQSIHFPEPLAPMPTGTVI